VPALIRNLLPRVPFRFETAPDPRGKFRDPRFASFISATNRKTLNTDFKDAVLKGRKVVRYALVAAVACGGAWVLVESAHALTMF
jgi:hypothetical protein